MTDQTPGLPDQEAIVGDWDGSKAAQRDRDAEAYAVLRRGAVQAYLHALRQREIWAISDQDGAVARAVAYQSMAGQIQRAIEAGDHAALAPGLRA